MADYTLPDLPYDYGALEPYISGEIMELHHSKHHATYVKGANRFRAQFNATALGVQGSGWSVLAWDRLGQRMVPTGSLRTATSGR